MGTSYRVDKGTKYDTPGCDYEGTKYSVNLRTLIPAMTFLCMQNWDCNYRYAIDNVMHLMHGRYLHASSHSMAQGDTRAEMVLKTTDTGLIFE